MQKKLVYGYLSAYKMMKCMQKESFEICLIVNVIDV